MRAGRREAVSQSGIRARVQQPSFMPLHVHYFTLCLHMELSKNMSQTRIKTWEEEGKKWKIEEKVENDDEVIYIQ